MLSVLAMEKRKIILCIIRLLITRGPNLVGKKRSLKTRRCMVKGAELPLLYVSVSVLVHNRTYQKPRTDESLLLRFSWGLVNGKDLLSHKLYRNEYLSFLLI